MKDHLHKPNGPSGTRSVGMPVSASADLLIFSERLFFFLSFLFFSEREAVYLEQ